MLANGLGHPMLAEGKSTPETALTGVLVSPRYAHGGA
jgi:hypothetical protein